MAIYNRIKRKTSSDETIADIERDDVIATLRRYAPRIALALGALVIIVALTIGYVSYSRARSNATMSRIYEAIESAPIAIGDDPQNLDAQIESIQNAIAQGGDRHLLAIGYLELARLQKLKGDYQAALARYELAERSADRGLLRDLASFGAAGALAREGRFDEALEKYRRLKSASTDIPLELIEYHQAMALADSGARSEALSIIERIARAPTIVALGIDPDALINSLKSDAIEPPAETVEPASPPQQADRADDEQPRQKQETKE